MAAKRELVDIAAELRGESGAAYRIFDGKVTAWVPKSLVEMTTEGRFITFTMPEWLAIEKGFI